MTFLVLQVTSSDADSRAGWLRAELDDTLNLPGLYVKPHPGFDGRFGTADDRLHLPIGTGIPICAPDLTAADERPGDVYADRSAVSQCYNSNPPTSGPHVSSPMPFKVLDNPAAKESLLHNMEHGGVVIWYNTENPVVIQRLAKITNDELNRKKLVVMTRYSEMEPETIVLTAWTRLDKFTVSQLDAKRVTEFIEAHSRRFNPEGF